MPCHLRDYRVHDRIGQQLATKRSARRILGERECLEGPSYPCALLVQADYVHADCLSELGAQGAREYPVPSLHTGHSEVYFTRRLAGDLPRCHLGVVLANQGYRHVMDNVVNEVLVEHVEHARLHELYGVPHNLSPIRKPSRCLLGDVDGVPLDCLHQHRVVGASKPLFIQHSVRQLWHSLVDRLFAQCPSVQQLAPIRRAHEALGDRVCHHGRHFDDGIPCRDLVDIRVLHGRTLGHIHHL